jgi:hypothetical protein
LLSTVSMSFQAAEALHLFPFGTCPHHPPTHPPTHSQMVGSSFFLVQDNSRIYRRPPSPSYKGNTT